MKRLFALLILLPFLGACSAGTAFYFEPPVHFRMHGSHHSNSFWPRFRHHRPPVIIAPVNPRRHGHFIAPHQPTMYKDYPYGYKNRRH